MNIAFIGGIGAGKTTIAKFIEKNNEDYKVFSIASEVKHIAKMVLGREIDKGIDRPLLCDIGEILKTLPKNITFDQEKWLQDLVKASGWFKEYLEENSNEVFNPNYFISKLFQNQEFKKCFDLGFALCDDLGFEVEVPFWKSNDLSQIIRVDTDYNLRVQNCIQRDGCYKKEWELGAREVSYPKLTPDRIIKNSVEGNHRSLYHVYNELFGDEDSL